MSSVSFDQAHLTFERSPSLTLALTIWLAWLDLELQGSTCLSCSSLPSTIAMGTHNQSHGQLYLFYFLGGYWGI